MYQLHPKLGKSGICIPPKRGAREDPLWQCWPWFLGQENRAADPDAKGRISTRVQYQVVVLIVIYSVDRVNPEISEKRVDRS